MIMSFQEIATAGGAQPRPEKVAKGISTALFITLEGISLSVPAIFFFAFFRNRIAQMTMEANKVADRTINSLVAAAKTSKSGLSRTHDPSGGESMAGQVQHRVRAEPNLTPLLDVVFQLITFFMLMINFSCGQLRPTGPRCPSPARLGRSRTASRSPRIAWCSTSTRTATSWSAGRSSRCNKAVQAIKHQADLVKLNLKAAGLKVEPRRQACRRRSSSGPTRTRRSPRCSSLIKACQTNGFRKFALKAMNGSSRPSTANGDWHLEDSEPVPHFCRGAIVNRRGSRCVERRRQEGRRAEEPHGADRSMLDMAFQLLTFFVLTYHPMPSEGQFVMNLLPPQPATAMAAPTAPSDAAASDTAASLRTLPTS